MGPLSDSLSDLWPVPSRTGRRHVVRRYEIRTAKRATPQDLERLRRAFGRMLSRGAQDVRAVEVSTMRGCFRVGMETVGSARQVRRDAEALFAEAWYDAFGPRSSTHIGVLDDEPVPFAV
jgi:hypothetical protein